MQLELRALLNSSMNKMKKAIFLDRDGILNKERKDYVKSIEDLELIPNIGNCISKIKKNSFLAIVITNQSVINRGLTSHENIFEIHNFIQKYLKKFNTKIDAFYYCPHRPDEDCVCRKPKSGLILQAAIDYKIDLTQSWMIGDHDIDVECGINAGCNSIKISEPNLLEEKLDYILNS